MQFTEEWPDKSHCLKKKISKHVWCLPKGMWEPLPTHGRRYSGQMRQTFCFMAIKENTMSGANPTPLITREHHPHSEAWWWQHHAVGMFGDHVSVHAPSPSQELLEHDGTRTSQPAKPSPNPDDAGPIVRHLMGHLVVGSHPGR